MQVNSWPFVGNRYVTEERKLQQFEYLEKEKSFFDEMTNHFHDFGRDVFS